MRARGRERTTRPSEPDPAGGGQIGDEDLALAPDECGPRPSLGPPADVRLPRGRTAQSPASAPRPARAALPGVLAHASHPGRPPSDPPPPRGPAADDRGRGPADRRPG